MNIEQLRTKRRELAHRRRRIIMNNDGDDFPAETVEEFLAKRTTGLVGTHVDTISYCPINHGFAIGLHNSKACDILVRNLRGYWQYAEGQWPYPVTEAISAPGGWNHPSVFIEGKDVLEIILEFCREHNLEMWASIRMNDIHDQHQEKSRTPWKSEHPERWLASPPDLGGGLEEKAFTVSEGALEHPERWVPRGSCGCWYGVDYARDDVRDKIFEIIAEICERYDVDGIELDFLRFPMIFKTTAQGEPEAGRQNCDKMTELVCRIREMTEEIGLSRQRPIIVATRVPDDPELAVAFGLDTRAWLKQGLVDVLIAGTAARIRPWKEFVELGHSHDVPVYACAIEYSVPHEQYRGRALCAWASGVDGIYIFNEFNPEDPVFTELGDMQKLLELDRVTPVDNANVTRLLHHLTRLPGVRRFLKPAPRLPMILPEGKEQTFEFTAGEDGRHLAASRTPHAALHLLFSNIDENDRIEVALNEHRLDSDAALRDCPKPGWIVYRDAGPFLRFGDNSLTIELKSPDRKREHPIQFADLKLHVSEKIPDFQATCPESAGADSRPFLVTEKEIVPPTEKRTANQQWLLDELELARSRVPVMYEFCRKQFSFPADPVEEPLPGWHSLAVLFDTDEMDDFCEKEMMLAFLRTADPERLTGEIGIHAGYLAGTWSLAGLVIRSKTTDNLDYIADRFGRGCEVEGLLALPIRFLHAEDDGYLIPRAFAILQRGTLENGVFTQSGDCCWEPTMIFSEDLAATTWRLG